MRGKIATVFVVSLFLAAPVRALEVPSLPSNPTIEDLQALIVTLTAILVQLQRAQAQRAMCPSYQTPICFNGIVTSQGKDARGCPLPLLCMPHGYRTAY